MEKKGKSEEVPSETPQKSTPTDETKETGSVKKDEKVGDGGGGGEESWGNWFSSTLENAKSKSTEMFEFLKQDLSEFGEVVSEAGRELRDKLNLEESAKSAVEGIGEGMSTILGQMSSIFGVEPEDGDEDPILIDRNGPLLLRRIETRLYTLAMDESLFVVDPPESERFGSWLSSYDPIARKKEGEKWLGMSPHLQLQHSVLVPTKVSEEDFWKRFMYQVDLVKEEEEVMAVEDALEEKRKNKGRKSSTESPPDLESDMVSISEEDQKRLLAEYEEEMRKNGNISSSSSSSPSASFSFVSRDPHTHEPQLD